MPPIASIEQLSHYCKATADSQRLQILRVLSKESFGVLELCQVLEVGQSALSHHLKILANASLVETRREGTSIFYRRALIHAEDPLRLLRQALFESIDGTELAIDHATRIRAVYDCRHGQAKSFFKKNAHRFQENQDLIAEYHHYSQCIDDVLDNESIPSNASAIEIGPGDSDLILTLATRFHQITAIDNTVEMLEKTQRKTTAAGKDNVKFLFGELHDHQGDCELLVLNMVLHHLASPTNFFFEAKQHLKAGGCLLIADLCAHDQDWTRDTCGDLWLGFDADELDGWASVAGFTQGQSLYLGLKNGFQVQVRTYH
ncbi:MAG: metalloregulator ArsR/SmtB family transcription factor [Pseudomonadales bacterium]|nr:metalloregulator ArsR/SmtB family transcription factor [Pseudomonadales bacterium]